jgi:hypothetical protein
VNSRKLGRFLCSKVSVKKSAPSRQLVGASGHIAVQPLFPIVLEHSLTLGADFLSVSL